MEMAAKSPARASDANDAETRTKSGPEPEPEPEAEAEPEPLAVPGPEPEPDTDPWKALGPIAKREPAVKLLSPISGLEPLSWSEDHRLSASCTSGISLMEIVCDVHSYSQDLIIHRSFIPVPDKVCVLKVGPESEVREAKQKLASSKDPAVSQSFMMDRVMNPEAGALPPLRGVKYVSWSPLGCDPNGRCLVALLALDGRLTVHGSPGRLQWSLVVDLTERYGGMLEEKEYSLAGAEAPLGPLEEHAELRRRYRMQSPVRMEWSSVRAAQPAAAGGEAGDPGSALLAVLMENGDVVIWQFHLPVLGEDSIASCSTIQSGVPAPSTLAWWDYEHTGRKMSGLIVGSAFGPLKILPVNLKAVKGYFTLRQPVVLWQETDQIPVHSIKCVSLFHPHQKCNCSLVVASRGSYLFWCLLLISKAGLNVHNSHVTGLHATPIIALATVRHGGAIFTCASDSTIKKLTPVFTDTAVSFRQETIDLPEGVAGCRTHGLAVSPSGAYLALATTEGITEGQHPVSQNHQVQFVTLKTPDEAGAALLASPVQNLFRQTDMLDLVRWKVLRDKRILPALQEELDDKVHASGCAYLWRYKLFLLRVLHQSLQKAPTEARWKPSHQGTKVFVGEEEEEEEDEEEEDQGGAEDEEEDQEGGEGRAGKAARAQETEGRPSEEQMSETVAWIEAVESHLTREHMKRVLGEVYLHSSVILETNSIPARGLCDFLTSDPTYEDRAARVLIGHLSKKVYKQNFPEYCSLCKEVLPFTDRKQAICSKGHMWHRCVLTYQACQTLGFRRCLLQDSIARHPMPEDPDWLKRILQGPCTFCDSPLL